MPISRNAMFYLLIVGAILLVLFAGGAMPPIIQFFTLLFQAIGSVVMSLIRR